ncbi:MAG: type II secretion system protein, partial [Kiritimatiellia bacterium]
MSIFSCQSIRRGFTLIELLVTISIIAILMGMIVPVFSTMRTNARIAKTKVGAKNLETAFRAYLDHYKTWPNPGTEQEISDSLFDMLLGVNPDNITFYEFDQPSVDARKALDGFADPDSPGDR